MILAHVHELRNERAEEHQHFWVGEQHHKTLQEKPAARRRRRRIGVDAFDRAADQPDAEPDKIGGSRAATVLGGRGLFASANGEKLKAVSGMVQRTCSIATLLCDRFRGMRRYSAPWRLMVRTALIPDHPKTILYRLYNPASAG